MGLDMYAYTADANLVGDDQLNPNLSDESGDRRADVNGDFAYWRKFNHLHGWMERLYKRLGGTDRFNCVPIRLLPQDIDQLEADLTATLSGERNALPATAGSFFGGTDVDPRDIEDLKAFIANSRKAFTDGLAVIYDSWW